MNANRLGQCVCSPKHGNGQIVDKRLQYWIVLYNDSRFGQYTDERLEMEFTLQGFKALPAGFPKLMQAPVLQSFEERMQGTPQPKDNRPYKVYFVNFVRRILDKIEQG